MDGNMVFNIFVFVLFTLLWLAFAFALLVRREQLQTTWQSLRKLPLLIQLALWLLFLPLMLGLWIWNTTWPGWLRLALVAGIAWWNVFVFFPRAPLA